ncbi:DEKNAAC105048 [Brettanomyces naardenensis]|uniref:Efficient mitochondria targeting-associated protein 19 n=1 Tax=Brettanomyces naardenensis TaxID=13370 RepID=A0A448YSA3_BRENA|nr:DEKNAAC105048 [Brettanomyces naardenensis]
MTVDTAYFFYFLIHTPLTLLIDDTFLIPAKYQLPIQRTLYEYQVVHNKDFLASELPLWMQYFVAVELVFQLPVFLISIGNYLKNGSKRLSTWLYPFILMYAFNAAFTSFQCLVYIYIQGPSYGLSSDETYTLLGLYTPTFVIPMLMIIDITVRLLKQSPKLKTN